MPIVGATGYRHFRKERKFIKFRGMVNLFIYKK